MLIFCVWISNYLSTISFCIEFSLCLCKKFIACKCMSLFPHFQLITLWESRCLSLCPCRAVLVIIVLYEILKRKVLICKKLFVFFFIKLLYLLGPLQFPKNLRAGFSICAKECCENVGLPESVDHLV